MMLLAGTIPVKDLPMTLGPVRKEGESLVVNGLRIPCAQGSAAMISAALVATEYLNLAAPVALVVGDTGQGIGSRQMYDYLIQKVAELSPQALTLHYFLPDMALMRKLCEAVCKCARRPVMIADAASMYVAKAVGLASSFDIFTPDATEMAFLADKEATHPAYINRHLFDTDITRTPDLVAAAYRNNGAARLLLVKGSIDYVVRDGDILATVTEPDVPALEAVGGTGDTITGLVSAFVHSGMEPHRAAIVAARANRVAGHLAEATPATRVSSIISQFPAVFEQHLSEWSRTDCTEGGKHD